MDMRCEPCRITFTSEQVDNKCCVCERDLKEVIEMESITGTVIDVMEKKNKNGEIFWNAKIDNKTFNFNQKPETETYIYCDYTSNEWTDEKGEKHTSRWVQDFEVVEKPTNVGQEMQNAQAPFQKATEVKGDALDPKNLMQASLIDAVVICNNLNEMAFENKTEQIKWNSEDIQKIGVSLFIARSRR